MTDPGFVQHFLELGLDGRQVVETADYDMCGKCIFGSADGPYMYMVYIFNSFHRLHP